MISGKPRKIKRYWLIDHRAEGLVVIVPQDGEEIIGIPFGYADDNSMPFIEHRTHGFVARTVNAADVSVIDFEEVTP